MADILRINNIVGESQSNWEANGRTKEYFFNFKVSNYYEITIKCIPIDL